jgi:SAM-dependent methyltransferase
VIPPPHRAFPMPADDTMSPLDTYLRDALRTRSLSDHEFDGVYPTDIQRVSRRFWTPLAVVWRAAMRLDALNVTRVLDIGSGAGKFCVATAAQLPHISFVGVEHRLHLVQAARQASSRMGTPNAQFTVGDATRADLDQFDAVYLFNPFAENVFDDEERLDSTVELSLGRYRTDLRRIWMALGAMRIGTIVLTYHGFGAPLPRAYECLHADPVGSDRLCVWRKVREVPKGHPCLTPVTDSARVTDPDPGARADEEG